MNKLIFLILSAFLFSCEKSNDDVNLNPNTLSVTDLGIQYNVQYTVQRLENGVFVNHPGPVWVKFLDNKQVEEKVATNDSRVNDYTIKGKGSINATSLNLIFHALAPRCDLSPCQIVTSASNNTEIYKQGDDILVKRFTDATPDTYRLLR